MKFDLEAYEKVFPAQQPQITTDSAVDGYTPTADEANGKPDEVEKAVEDVEKPAQGVNLPANGENPPKMDEFTNGGINVHDEVKTPISGEIQPTEGN